MLVVVHLRLRVGLSIKVLEFNEIIRQDLVEGEVLP